MQRYVQSRMPRSFRAARPAVPRPLPRRHPGRAWLRAVSSLLLVAVLAVALLDAAPLLTGRPPVALDLPALLAARLTIGYASHRPSPPAPTHGVRLTITAGDRSWFVAPADLAAMLPDTGAGQRVTTRHVDRAAIAAYVARLGAVIDRPGRDAAVLYDGGIVRVRRGRDGYVVDRVVARDQLAAALRRGRTATVAWPTVPGPTVSNREANWMADQLRRTLRTTVVWLPRRHWALTPRQIAAALTLKRVVTPTTAHLVARLDPAALAARLPGSAGLVATKGRAATIVARGGHLARTQAVVGRYPNYAALAAEMLRPPPGRAVYHLPIGAYPPAPAPTHLLTPKRTLIERHAAH